MKTVILILFVSIGINANAFMIHHNAPLQQTTAATPSFMFIHGNQTGRGYNLQWKLSAVTGVKNFIVECTYEDPYDPYSVWQTKGVIPLSNGIGKFSDFSVLPGIINYRITVIGTNNTTLTVSDIFTDVIQ